MVTASLPYSISAQTRFHSNAPLANTGEPGTEVLN